MELQVAMLDATGQRFSVSDRGAAGERTIDGTIPLQHRRVPILAHDGQRATADRRGTIDSEECQGASRPGQVEDTRKGAKRGRGRLARDVADDPETSNDLSIGEAEDARVGELRRTDAGNQTGRTNQALHSVSYIPAGEGHTGSPGARRLAERPSEDVREPGISGDAGRRYDGFDPPAFVAGNLVPPLYRSLRNRPTGRAAKACAEVPRLGKPADRVTGNLLT